jgi:hypothetical protein
VAIGKLMTYQSQPSMVELQKMPLLQRPPTTNKGPIVAAKMTPKKGYHQKQNNNNNDTLSLSYNIHQQMNIRIGRMLKGGGIRIMTGFAFVPQKLCDK